MSVKDSLENFYESVRSYVELELEIFKLSAVDRTSKILAQMISRVVLLFFAGLGLTWPYDPDVKVGRLKPESELAAIFYGNKLKPEQKTDSNILDQNRTVWAIAGKKYDSPDTLYKLPNDLIISGNRVDSRVGWHRVPIGTKIYLY